MKALFISVLLALLPSKGLGQLVVDAGNDAKMCNYFDTITLGGHPAASGGKAPYLFQWKCRFYHQYPPYPVQYILNNTASPNPTINTEGFNLNDTIEFYLTVTDSEQNSLSDSVKVIISSIFILTRENGVTINIGDSAQLSPRNFIGGIPPFSYLWTPKTGLSDASIDKPWAKPSVSTSYSVRLTDAIGCESSDWWWVEVRTTGIDKIENRHTSVVHPDPVTNNSVLTLNTPSGANMTIKLFDQSGKTVFSGRFYQDYPVGEKISSPGIYLYYVYSNNTPISSGKIIKQ